LKIYIALPINPTISLHLAPLFTTINIGVCLIGLQLDKKGFEPSKRMKEIFTSLVCGGVPSNRSFYTELSSQGRAAEVYAQLFVKSASAKAQFPAQLL
jgi:hypothetical protein